MDSLVKALLLFTFVHCSLSVQFSQMQAVVTAAGSPISHELKALLSTVCKKADDFNVCIQTLESIPKIWNATNHKDIENIALGAAIDQTRSIRDFFAVLLRNETLPDYQVALSTCVEAFKEAEGDFNVDGVKGLAALTKVHGARSGEMRCEEDLVNHHFDFPLVEPKLNNWLNYYGVAFNAVDAVENANPPPGLGSPL